MEKRACFIGHRKIEQSVDLINRLTCEIRRLITEESVAFFLFGAGATLIPYAIQSSLLYKRNFRIFAGSRILANMNWRV